MKKDLIRYHPVILSQIINKIICNLMSQKGIHRVINTVRRRESKKKLSLINLTQEGINNTTIIIIGQIQIIIIKIKIITKIIIILKITTTPSGLMNEELRIAFRIKVVIKMETRIIITKGIHTMQDHLAITSRKVRTGIIRDLIRNR